MHADGMQKVARDNAWKLKNFSSAKQANIKTWGRGWDNCLHSDERCLDSTISSHDSSELEPSQHDTVLSAFQDHIAWLFTSKYQGYLARRNRFRGQKPDYSEVIRQELEAEVFQLNLSFNGFREHNQGQIDWKPPPKWALMTRRSQTKLPLQMER